MSNETKETRRPTHEVFMVTGDGPKSWWTKIGIAFTNKDDKGFNLFLDAVPLTGRVVVMPFKAKDAAGNKGGQQ
jgi:hypothetical protein